MIKYKITTKEIYDKGFTDLKFPIGSIVLGLKVVNGKPAVIIQENWDFTIDGTVNIRIFTVPCGEDVNFPGTYLDSFHAINPDNLDECILKHVFYLYC